MFRKNIRFQSEEKKRSITSSLRLFGILHYGQKVRTLILLHRRDIVCGHILLKDQTALGFDRQTDCGRSQEGTMA